MRILWEDCKEDAQTRHFKQPTSFYTIISLVWKLLVVFRVQVRLPLDTFQDIKVRMQKGYGIRTQVPDSEFMLKQHAGESSPHKILPKELSVFILLNSFICLKQSASHEQYYLTKEDLFKCALSKVMLITLALLPKCQDFSTFVLTLREKYC